MPPRLAPEVERQPEGGECEKPPGHRFSDRPRRNRRADGNEGGQHRQPPAVEKPSADDLAEDEPRAEGVPFEGVLPSAVVHGLAREEERYHKPEKQQERGRDEGREPHDTP